jgi:hypothetical protein
MSERAPYSRVYWQIVDDPKFVTVYDDDHAFALWLRLLLAADQAHPASASIPVGSRKAAIATLVEARLITVTGSRFRVVGLDAERGKRSDTARNASASRWQSNGNASGMPRRDETRRDKPTRAPARELRTEEEPAAMKDAYRRLGLPVDG